MVTFNTEIIIITVKYVQIPQNSTVTPIRRQLHRHRSSVNFDGDIFARTLCIKINKMPEFYVIIARKKYQNDRIFTIFARKINKVREYYVTFARKCPNFT